MQLVTKNKTINLVFTTRKIVKLTDMLKGDNFEDIYFKAMSKQKIEALGKMLLVFAEDEIGAKAFSSDNDVYDFIDEYKTENDKTYSDIFQELAEAINKEGFFNSKMSAKALKAKVSDPFSAMNLDEILKSSAEKAVATMAEQELQNQMNT